MDSVTLSYVNSTPRRSYHAKLSVPLNRRVRGFIDFRNVNDEPRLRYSGVRERRTSYEICSWTINAGFDWRF